MNLKILSLSVLLICFICPKTSAKEIVFAGREGGSYYTDILRHALSYFPAKNYQVTHYKSDIPKKRLFNSLSNNQGVDVMSGSSTAEREAQFDAVYFPILRGLKGWRLPIINKETPTIFKEVKSKEELKKYIPVQFHTWTATTIFEHNGFNIVKGSNYKGLYLMLSKQRVDFLPRSLLDISRDISRYQHLDLILDPYILIKYPSAYYFYVRKGNTELVNDIKQGLENSLTDGSFEQIFMKTFGKTIKTLGISTRKIIELENPYLLDTMPIKRKELWGEF